MIKKQCTLLMIMLLCLSMITGCGGDDENVASKGIDASAESKINMSNVAPGGDVTFSVYRQWGWDYNDLYDYFESSRRSGESAAFDADKGESIKLFMPDGITEIIDFNTMIADKMTVVKYDSAGNVLNRFVVAFINAAANETSLVSGDVSPVASSADNASVQSRLAVSSSLSSAFELQGKQIITLAGASDDSVLEKAVKEFNKSNSEYAVQIVSSGEKSGITTRAALKLAVADGTAPDIVYMDQLYIVSSGEEGLLRDLSSYGISNYKSRFTAECYNSLGSGNAVYALPFDCSTSCLAYDLDIFSNLGLSVPTNYEQLKSAGQKIFNDYPDKYTPLGIYLGSDTSKTASSFLTWLWRCGGEVLSSSGNAAFAGDAGITALKMIKDLNTQHLTDKDWEISDLYSGKGAMANVEFLRFNDTFGKGAKMNFAVALLPTVLSGVKAYSCLTLNAYAVTACADAKKASVAADFIRFYCTNREYQISGCVKKESLPSLFSAQTADEFLSKEAAVYIKQLQISKARPSIPGWDTIEGYISDAVSSVISGEKTVEDALDYASKKADRRISRSK